MPISGGIYAILHTTPRTHTEHKRPHLNVTATHQERKFICFSCYFAYNDRSHCGRSILCHGDTWKRSPCALSILCRFHGFIRIFTSCGEDGDDPFFCLIPPNNRHIVTKFPQSLTVQRLEQNRHLSPTHHYSSLLITYSSPPPRA